MGYSLDVRSEHLHHVSQQKWNFRKQGEFYNPMLDSNTKLALLVKHRNSCKYQPKRKKRKNEENKIKTNRFQKKKHISIFDGVLPLDYSNKTSLNSTDRTYELAQSSHQNYILYTF